MAVITLSLFFFLPRLYYESDFYSRRLPAHICPIYVASERSILSYIFQDFTADLPLAAYDTPNNYTVDLLLPTFDSTFKDPGYFQYK